MFLKKIHPPLERAIEEFGFKEPNAAQNLTFPIIKSGANLLSIGSKGTGSSTSMVIGIIQRLKKAVGDIPRAIVLVKDKEHGEEVEEIFKQLAKYTDLRIYRTFKGGDILRHRDDIYMGTDVVIGTAKRLNEIYLANGLNYRDVMIYAIDHAERILKAEVVVQVDKFTDRMPKCQHLIFSIEKSNGIDRYIDRYLDRVQEVLIPKKENDSLA